MRRQVHIADLRTCGDLSCSYVRSVRERVLRRVQSVITLACWTKRNVGRGNMEWFEE